MTSKHFLDPTPDDWNNRLRYIRGVNSTARWLGECKCGYSTGEIGFNAADTALREHISNCNIYKSDY